MRRIEPDLGTLTIDNICKLIKINPHLTSRQVLINLLEKFIIKQGGVDVSNMRGSLFKTKYPNLFFAKKILQVIGPFHDLFPCDDLKFLLSFIPKNAEIQKLLQAFFSIYVMDAIQLNDVIGDKFAWKDKWREDISKRIQSIIRAKDNRTLSGNLSLTCRLASFVDCVPADSSEEVSDAILKLFLSFRDDETGMQFSESIRKVIVRDILNLSAWLLPSQRFSLVTMALCVLASSANSSISELACDFVMKAKDWLSIENCTDLQRDHVEKLLARSDRQAIILASRSAHCLAEFLPVEKRSTLLTYFAVRLDDDSLPIRLAAIEAFGRLRQHLDCDLHYDLIESIRANLQHNNMILCIASCETLSQCQASISETQKSLIARQIIALIVNNVDADSIVNPDLIEKMHMAAFSAFDWFHNISLSTENNSVIERMIAILSGEEGSDDYKITTLQYLVIFREIVSPTYYRSIIKLMIALIADEKQNVDIRTDAMAALLGFVTVIPYDDKLTIFQQLRPLILSAGFPIEPKMMFYYNLKLIQRELPQESRNEVLHDLLQTLYKDDTPLSCAISLVAIGELADLLKQDDTHAIINEMSNFIMDDKRELSIRTQACVNFTKLCSLQIPDMAAQIDKIMNALLAEMISDEPCRITACKLLKYFKVPCTEVHYNKLFDTLLKCLNDDDSHMRILVCKALINFIPFFSTTQRIAALCCLRASCYYQDLSNVQLEIAFVKLYSSVYRKDAIVSMLNTFVPPELSNQIVNYRI